MPLTGGIFYCRDSGYFSVSASNEIPCNLTRTVLRNRQQKHTARTLANIIMNDNRKKKIELLKLKNKVNNDIKFLTEFYADIEIIEFRTNDELNKMFEFNKKHNLRNYNLEFTYSPSENETVKSDLSKLIDDSFLFKPYDLSDQTYCLTNKSEFDKIFEKTLIENNIPTLIYTCNGKISIVVSREIVDYELKSGIKTQKEWWNIIVGGIDGIKQIVNKK